MDRLEAMSIVLAVVEAGSLSAAGRRLRLPLATVSRKVSDLEAHLRTKLFNRSSRKLVLTDAGSSYVAACKRILADVTEAERAASGEYAAPTGELVLTAPISLGRLHVVPMLADFFTAYPDIDVRLVLADRVVSLIEDHIDVALRIGTLPDSSLIALRVGTVRRVTCASPDYLRGARNAAHARRISPAMTASASRASSRRTSGPSCATTPASRCRCIHAWSSAMSRRPAMRRAPASASPARSTITSRPHARPER